MANSVAFVLVFIVFCGSAVGTRTKLFTTNVPDSVSAAPDDGICKMMAEPQNYTCQEHTVTTQDGYVLSMQRILVGGSGGAAGNQTPVLLVHGLLVDAATWLLGSPDQSLGFILADNGFDVWLASLRGTKYSLRHTTLTLEDHAYWDWSWDELVAYDLPAAFEYVHNETGQKLHYIGHSQGTLTALASFSKGKLVDMVRSAAVLSPIAYLAKMTSPIARYAADNFTADTPYWLGIHEFDPFGPAAIQLLVSICQKPDVDCSNFLAAFTGPNCCLTPSVLAAFLENEPQNTSTKNMIHLAQMIEEGTIAMYDYKDEEENRKHYGQSAPPAYNMTSIPTDLPLFLSYGGQDALADGKDVQLLLDSLKDHEEDKLVVHFVRDYAHADFVMGSNAKQAVYDPLVAFFQAH